MHGAALVAIAAASVPVHSALCRVWFAMLPAFDSIRFDSIRFVSCLQQAGSFAASVAVVHIVADTAPDNGDVSCAAHSPRPHPSQRPIVSAGSRRVDLRVPRAAVLSPLRCGARGRSSGMRGGIDWRVSSTPIPWCTQSCMASASSSTVRALRMQMTHARAQVRQHACSPLPCAVGLDSYAVHDCVPFHRSCFDPKRVGGSQGSTKAAWAGACFTGRRR